MNKELIEQTSPSFPATKAWFGLSVVYSGFLAVGFVFHFVPPVLPAVIEDLGITHGQAGLLMSLFALPGILFSMTGGWLADRFGGEGRRQPGPGGHGCRDPGSGRGG